MKKYSNFKLRVLAKTDGSNSHKVHGCLSKIINGVDNIKYYKVMRKPDEIPPIQKEVDEAFKKLNKLLKTSFSESDVLVSNAS